MVSTYPAKICFIIFLIIAFIITMVSLFTPAWKVADNNGNNNNGYGLVTSTCNNNGQFNNGQYNNGQYNGQYMGVQCTGSYYQLGSWQGKQDYEKAALAFMIIAGVFELFAIIAALATIKSENRAFVIAPILALIAAISLIIAFAVYAGKLHENQNNYNNGYYNRPGQPIPAPPVGGIPNMGYGYGNEFKLGYSYWLSVVAFIILLITVVIGFVGACVSGTGYSSWSQNRSPPRRHSEVHVVRRKSLVGTTNNA